MVGDDATRFALKTELWERVEALGVHRSLFPSSEETINKIVDQLESMNPIPYPLSTNHLSTLLGHWQLVYASRGTIVTRTVASIPDFWGSIKIKQVWQQLERGGDESISASNGALFDLSLLGEWQIQANGVWRWSGDREKAAKVKFGTFSMQATKPFGISLWSFPKIKIPVLEFFQNEALWITSYLDEEMRVGRGATGNLFVFRRRE
ncbi:PAP fibrillin [Scytonema hofmannii PCC 7110]|uniref:PAP fibrillin n=1 Tax=Scytonema hofmannii PCC 7110 TaxID=128403 RepID=A0A139XGB4_9CYAN|nr:PAP/fibrillin family protein [Scytonema hofmannii]KYC43719.1 PAP fibrillin [Scytonema hofmannii PCC 7110]